MTGHQKDNFFVLTLMHGGPWGGCGGPFLAPKSAFFYATTIKPPFFQVRRTRLHGIICPPCPEVTLDNFGFPVGGRLVPRGVVFRLPGRILAFFGPKWAPTATPRPSVHQGQYKKVVFLVSSCTLPCLSVGHTYHNWTKMFLVKMLCYVKTFFLARCDGCFRYNCMMLKVKPLPKRLFFL